MFSSILLAVLVLGTVFCGAGHGHDHLESLDFGPYVEELTEETFDDYVNGVEFVLMEFYAPWCGHCKASVPKVKAASKELEEYDNMRIAVVNCDESKDLCGAFGVKGFPTIKLWKNGEFAKDYDQQREAASMVRYLKKAALPALTPLEDEETLSTFVESHKGMSTVVVGVGDVTKSPLTSITDTFPNFEFGHIPKSEGIGTFSEIGYYIIPKSEEADTVFVNHNDLIIVSLDLLTEKVREAGFPLIHELSGETFQLLSKRNVPFVIGFVLFSDDEARNDLEQLMEPAAKTHNSDFVFTVSDASIYGKQLENMGGDPLDGFPQIAILDAQKRKNYLYKGELSGEAISEWIGGVGDGTIEAFFKSEPIPKDPYSEGPVYKLVGKMYDKIVKKNKGKDVLVKFYAEWCPHCKSLAPIYEELAEGFEECCGENLIIADFEATKNDHEDMRLEISGFPTIYFFPAGGKKPVAYSGDRTLLDLRLFLGKQAKASKTEVTKVLNELKEAGEMEPVEEGEEEYDEF